MSNNIKKNFIYLSAYKMLEMLLPVITSPMLSRRLGAEALGTYTYTYAVVSLFVVVAELGFFRYGIREVAKVRDDKEKRNQTYSDIFFTHIINAVGVLVIFLLYVHFACEGITRIYILVQGISIINNMLDNAFFFVGMENIKAVSIRDAAVKTAAFVMMIWLVKSPSDLLVYIILMVGCSLVSKLAALFYAGKFVRIVRPKLCNCRKHYKPMAVLMIPALASVIYQSMDKIMIEHFYGDTDVGYYECASKTLIPRNIISALGTVLCPHIAHLYMNGNKKEAVEKVGYYMVISMIMAFGFMFGIAAIAEEFAPWFWGEDFSVCAPMMVGLAAGIPIWTVGEVIRNQYLLPIGRDNAYTVSMVVGVMVNAVLNAVLIPESGAMGAIAATLAAELAMSAVQVWIVRKEIKCMKYLVSVLPYCMAGFIMFLTVRIIAGILGGPALLRIAVEIICGGVVFVMVSVLAEKAGNRTYVMDLMKKYCFVKQIGNRRK